MTRVTVLHICENFHVTESELLDPVIAEDGSVSGLMTSNAFYCAVCESPDMTDLEAREATDV